MPDVYQFREPRAFLAAWREERPGWSAAATARAWLGRTGSAGYAHNVFHGRAPLPLARAWALATRVLGLDELAAEYFMLLVLESSHRRRGVDGAEGYAGRSDASVTAYLAERVAEARWRGTSRRHQATGAIPPLPDPDVIRRAVHTLPAHARHLKTSAMKLSAVEEADAVQMVARFVGAVAADHTASEPGGVAPAGRRCHRLAVQLVRVTGETVVETMPSSWHSTPRGRSDVEVVVRRLSTGVAVSRYRVLECLGDDERADVYRVRAAGERVDHVLKRLKRVRARDLASLSRDWQALADVGNPHVLAVEETVDVGGAAGLVSGFVPGGRTLRALLDEGPLSAQVIGRLGDQVVDAVRAAHGVGVHHGDLRAEKVLIDDRAGTLTARVFDFGVAAADARAAGGRDARTASAAHADADAFGLGALLLGLATGDGTLTGPGLEATIEGVRAGRVAPEVLLRPGMPPALLEVLEVVLWGGDAARCISVERLSVLWAQDVPRRAVPAPAVLREHCRAFRKLVDVAVLARWHAQQSGPDLPDGSATPGLLVERLHRAAPARALAGCGFTPALLALAQVTHLEQRPVGPRWREGYARHTPEWHALRRALPGDLQTKLDAELRRARAVTGFSRGMLTVLEALRLDAAVIGGWSSSGSTWSGDEATFG